MFTKIINFIKKCKRGYQCRSTKSKISKLIINYDVDDISSVLNMIQFMWKNAHFNIAQRDERQVPLLFPHRFRGPE